MALPDFDPLVQLWFENRFGKPTKPQVRGWSEISAGPRYSHFRTDRFREDVSGVCDFIDQLVRAARAHTLEDLKGLPTRWESGWARTLFFRIMGIYLARRGWTQKRG